MNTTSKVDFAFFGCWDEAGHYMRTPDKQMVHDCVRVGIPRPEDLDGSRLFLPHPENVGEGRITYLPALNVTVLSWWNRIIDTRPGVNSHVICRGGQGIQTMWNVFASRFPDLAALHTKPIVGRTY
jgi:hypothetical protein